MQFIEFYVCFLYYKHTFSRHSRATLNIRLAVLCRSSCYSITLNPVSVSGPHYNNISSDNADVHRIDRLCGVFLNVGLHLTKQSMYSVRGMCTEKRRVLAVNETSCCCCCSPFFVIFICINRLHHAVSLSLIFLILPTNV